MRYLVKIFKALSDTNRIRILKMLQVRPLCVCEISDVLCLANSTVSKHLSILKDNKWVIYSLNRTTLENYVRDIIPLMQEWLPNDSTVRRDVDKVLYVDRNILCSVSSDIVQEVVHE